MQQWILQGQNGFNDLQITESPVPEASDNDVLVKFHAASLNYRDLMIVKVRCIIVNLLCSVSNIRSRGRIIGL